jgi:hypothetical protein
MRVCETDRGGRGLTLEDITNKVNCIDGSGDPGVERFIPPEDPKIKSEDDDDDSHEGDGQIALIVIDSRRLRIKFRTSLWSPTTLTTKS